MANELNDSDKTQATPEESPVRALSPPSVKVWARIKELKIAQWTLAYAAAPYVLLDGTKIVSDAFDWPRQLLRVVNALLSGYRFRWSLCRFDQRAIWLQTCTFSFY